MICSNPNCLRENAPTADVCAYCNTRLASTPAPGDTLLIRSAQAAGNGALAIANTGAGSVHILQQPTIDARQTYNVYGPSIFGIPDQGVAAGPIFPKTKAELSNPTRIGVGATTNFTVFAPAELSIGAGAKMGADIYVGGKVEIGDGVEIAGTLFASGAVSVADGAHVANIVALGSVLVGKRVTAGRIVARGSLDVGENARLNTVSVDGALTLPLHASIIGMDSLSAAEINHSEGFQLRLRGEEVSSGNIFDWSGDRIGPHGSIPAGPARRVVITRLLAKDLLAFVGGLLPESRP